jgi:hypothetical protein
MTDAPAQGARVHGRAWLEVARNNCITKFRLISGGTIAAPALG